MSKVIDKFRHPFSFFLLHYQIISRNQYNKVILCSASVQETQISKKNILDKSVAEKIRQKKLFRMLGEN